MCLHHITGGNFRIDKILKYAGCIHQSADISFRGRMIIVQGQIVHAFVAFAKHLQIPVGIGSVIGRGGACHYGLALRVNPFYYLGGFMNLDAVAPGIFFPGTNLPGTVPDTRS